MNLFEVLWDRKWALRSILSTIYFNFKCLPLSQAWKLPVILYKPHFQKLSGKVVLEGKLHLGVVQLGHYKVPFYPNSGVKINLEGTIVFRGTCMDYSALGNNIVIGNKSEVEILRTGVYLNPYNDK